MCYVSQIIYIYICIYVICFKYDNELNGHRGNCLAPKIQIFLVLLTSLDGFNCESEPSIQRRIKKSHRNRSSRLGGVRWPTRVQKNYTYKFEMLTVSVKTIFIS